MLEFLRKYQRYLYLVITVVIIISFSFFGTYSTLGSGNYREQIAFTAVDGTPVSRGELEQLVTFIGTDAHDKQVFGGLWGPNFLNDGVVSKDFFQTGLAQQLFAHYPNDLAQELDKRLEKEKHFTLYTHPQVPIVGIETAWSFYAPDLKTKYQTLRSQTSGATAEAFDARVQLYLAEKELPAPAIQYILNQQQRQYNLPSDPNLSHTDLSLFGYHTLDDWFGSRFLRLTAEFIINSAKIAEQRGYKVSKEEALADLMHNAEVSYQENRANPHLGVANSSEYFNEQLHRLSLDQNSAAKLWSQVLLFRRLFQDVGQGIFVDSNSLQPFNSYAKATVEGELYQLPPEFRFDNERRMQLFEVYLRAISQRPVEGKALLEMPTSFLSASQVLQNAPGVVQKRYLLDITQANKNLLQARVSVKESWNWEADEKNWESLVQKFPELELKQADTRDARMALIDSLDEATRAKVDAFARQAIVNAHPEWLEKALAGEPKRLSIALPYKGTTPFAGLKNPATLIALLDKAKKGEQDPALAAFSADNQTYYKIVLIDRSPIPEIATFAEAEKSGALEALNLSHPQVDKADLHKEIYEAYASGIAPEKAPSQLIEDVSASLRLFPYMQGALAQIKKNPANLSDWVQTSLSPDNEPNLLSKREPLANQWKLLMANHHEERAGESGDINLQELFTMEPGSWSRVQTPANGDLYFFQLKSKGSDATSASLSQQVMAAHALLSDEAQSQLMQQILEEIKAKKAISLDFMNLKEEERREEG